MITMNGALHPKGDVHRLYVPRTKSEQGLRGLNSGMQIRFVMNC